MVSTSKHIALLIAMLANVVLGVAQNLVPNGSFEEYTACPPSFGYAQYATGWQNLHTNSADYFNRCDTGLVAGVPFNTCGYQEPADGDAYVGLISAFPGLPTYREIVGTELLEPLVPGVPVCISFKVSVGGFGSWNGNSAVYTAKGVGVQFFTEFPLNWSSFLFPNNSPAYLDVVPIDTSFWYEVNATYVPDSAYTHIAIGNFFSDSLSVISPLDSSYGILFASYAFIDDVVLFTNSGPCVINNMNGSNSYNVELRDVCLEKLIDDKIILKYTSKGKLIWDLFDINGRLIATGNQSVGVSEFSISTLGLAKGTYLLRAYDDEGMFRPLRFFSGSP